MRQFICLSVAVLLLASNAAAEGLGSLHGNSSNKVASCVMASGLMEDSGMFISDTAVTVIGPGGWVVKIFGKAPATAKVDARDANGKPSDTLRKRFQTALAKCR